MNRNNFFCSKFFLERMCKNAVNKNSNHNTILSKNQNETNASTHTHTHTVVCTFGNSDRWVCMDIFCWFYTQQQQTICFWQNSTHDKHNFTRKLSKIFKQRNVMQQLFSLIRRWLMHVYAFDYHISLDSSLLLDTKWKKKKEEEEKGEKLRNYMLNQHLIYSILHTSVYLFHFFFCVVCDGNLEPQRR